MKSLVSRARNQLKRTPYYAQWKELGWWPDYFYWILRGRPVRSPHIIKQKTVREYAEGFGLGSMVETGTYYGEMVSAQRKNFEEIFSVEFVPELAEKARKRFAQWPHIHILQGDSKVVIPELLKTMTTPTLFWLDAGYYGWPELATDKSRLTVELDSILRHPVPGHVILMDDARGLNGRNGALTVEELSTYIGSEFPRRSVTVKHDILRITPKIKKKTQ